VNFTFRKNKLKVVLIVVVIFAITMSIVSGVDFVMNKIREGVVRGTLELRDYPPVYENHSTQQVWVVVALEAIYPPLVYYLTEDYELVASIEKYGDFEEGNLVTVEGVIHSKNSFDGSTKYLFVEVRKIQKGIVWEPVYNHSFVIEDINGDTLEVENNNTEVQEQVEKIKGTGEWKWIGGKVVTYGNNWGFRFDPDTITIADNVDERYKTNLQAITDNLDYWLQLERVFVWAKVTRLSAERVVEHRIYE